MIGVEDRDLKLNAANVVRVSADAGHLTTGAVWHLAERAGLLSAEIAVLAKDDTRNVHGRWCVRETVTLARGHSFLATSTRTGPIKANPTRCTILGRRIVTGVAAILNVALNFALIPPYGRMGAAIATVAAYTLLFVGMAWRAQRVFPVAYQWRRVATLGFASVGLTVFGKLMDVPLGVALALTAAFPLVLLLLDVWPLGRATGACAGTRTA